MHFLHMLSVRVEKGDNCNNKGGVDTNHKQAMEELISTKSQSKEDDRCTHAAGGGG